ncbi:ABC transporter ATP-binding protein [Cryobacterium algoritolerans]|uniref:ABC transporter ATP-binding protein n=1 Tax=Cryobacterium algoritolerans TaxID=1259184 RepID=A0A4R8WX79_9MICO|nr:ABC transporter ATP-binding protein [Cryobacterium algoritolerans]TFC20997.1 ABC transporter ATP-binding protein [Cryobacterium algoritolerans]
MNLVSVRNLRVTLPGSAAAVVDGVSFSIAAGQCFGIVGESGAGKTVTARSLIGLNPDGARVAADELTVAGVDARNLTERAWRRLRGAAVGLVGQDALVSLDPLRRVCAEVSEPLEVHEPGLGRADRARRVLQLLEQVAMPEPALRARQYPHELSGGLRQRALIASALAGSPALLIADEPTTALDATVQARIVRLLRELKESGLGLLLISHDLAIIRQLADEVAVMKDGRFVEVQAAARLFAAPQHPYTRGLLAAASLSLAPARPPVGEVVLAARDLAKTYGRAGRELRAVDGVSFELRAGHTVGMVGESGSGKSTVARMLLGTETPDRGDVRLHGEPWSSLPESGRRARRGGIQIIQQDSLSAFDPRASVLQILSEAIGLNGTPRRLRKARAVELLLQVALTDALLGRRAHQLSGGQRQRVAIARALAREPSILVCDEPVSALDVSIQSQVLELLASLQETRGLAMVFISHDLAVVRGLSHDILVMKDGVVVEQGAAAALFRAPQHPFTRELLAAHAASPRGRSSQTVS